jgi:uncharacterized protein (TIGR02246 family)
MLDRSRSGIVVLPRGLDCLWTCRGVGRERIEKGRRLDMTHRGVAWLWILNLTLLTPVAFVAVDAALASQDDEEAVREASTQFYAALNALFTGNLAPMSDIWSHADDVTYMGPGGGFQIGWDQVLANWQAQAAMKLGGEVRAEDVRITVGQSLAVVHNHERGENTNVEGKHQKVSIRATNVFRKEDGRWKMIGHHTDLLPYLQN